jgi:hypothetical protein
MALFPNTSVLLPTLLSSALLVSCASASMHSQAPAESAKQSTRSQQNLSAPEAAPAGEVANQAPSQLSEQAASTKPQLVKTAELSLIVKSVTESLQSINRIVETQRGDVLGLQDHPAGSNEARHTASMQIRVPQNQMDELLQALSQLGTVERRNLSAEDVSEQLTDFEARLRNLRKTEETLLQIMSRSGSVGDVLKVSQELSNVREQSERITAQLASLQNRVTYSRITLTLEEVLASSPPQRSVIAELQETWAGATQSVATLTTNLGKLGIWLIAYTPYWLAIAIAVVLWRRSFGQRSRVATADHPPED